MAEPDCPATSNKITTCCRSLPAKAETALLMKADLPKKPFMVKSGLRRFRDTNEKIVHNENSLAAIRLCGEGLPQAPTAAYIFQEIDLNTI
jgi:hypothetical protein